MVDGLYRVHFQTPLGTGAGVVYLSNGKLWGGDSVLYYVGNYILSGDALSASVVTARHTGGSQSVFGIDRVSIRLNGRLQGNTANLSGSSIEAPGIAFQAIMTKLID
jgi:hypothetical protein